MLLRNGWNQEWQLLYQKSLDLVSDFGEMENATFKKDSIEYSVIREITREMLLVDREYLIPITVLPRFEYKKEGKMHLAFLEKDKYLVRSDEFRTIIKSYLRSLDMNTLFVPPLDVCLKVGSARYNDGGVVRKDYERPESSFESGFLYQSFNPKPLGTREVWLPDKSTKLNNNFWMIIGRQFLDKCPTYPDTDPMVTWEKIKERLSTPFGSFDISGFGFQYIREWLFIIAEEIAMLFPNPDLEEMKDLFIRLLKDPKVQMPDGKFVYPPRGVGLGYYEDLKTIGVNALLQQFQPISIYGDQGILPRQFVIPAVQRLRSFGFELPSTKVVFNQVEIKWSGWTMSASSCTRAKLYFEPLVSIFTQRYHWERKQILASFNERFPEVYKKWMFIVPFQYELFFGFEFAKGDSLWNFHNSGVSSVAAVQTGHLRSWAVQRMKAPTDSIVDDFFYETPFFTQWKEADAKAFSIKRKSTYRNSMAANTAVFDYAHPYLVLNKNRRPDLPRIASLVSDYTEHKLIINHQMTTGKFLFGLSGNGATKALSLCSRHRNPWEAYATGGYKVATLWRGDPRATEEYSFLLEHILANVEQMNKYIVPRLDVYSFNYTQLFPHSRPQKRDLNDVPRNMYVPSELGSRKRAKPSYEVVSFDNLRQISLDGPKDDHLELKNVRDLLGDIEFRRHVSEPRESTPEEQEYDEELFLGEYASLEASDSE